MHVMALSSNNEGDRHKNEQSDKAHKQQICCLLMSLPRCFNKFKLHVSISSQNVYCTIILFPSSFKGVLYNFNEHIYGRQLPFNMKQVGASTEVPNLEIPSDKILK